MEQDHLLTFEVGPDTEIIEVHANEVGLDYLIAQLSRLRNKIAQGERDHLHLMTETWGGLGLTADLQDTSGQSTLVHHVKVYGWPKRTGNGVQVHRTTV